MSKAQWHNIKVDTARLTEQYLKLKVVILQESKSLYGNKQN